MGDKLDADLLGLKLYENNIPNFLTLSIINPSKLIQLISELNSELYFLRKENAELRNDNVNLRNNFTYCCIEKSIESLGKYSNGKPSLPINLKKKVKYKDVSTQATSASNEVPGQHTTRANVTIRLEIVTKTPGVDSTVLANDNNVQIVQVPQLQKLCVEENLSRSEIHPDSIKNISATDENSCQPSESLNYKIHTETQSHESGTILVSRDAKEDDNCTNFSIKPNAKSTVNKDQSLKYPEEQTQSLIKADIVQAQPPADELSLFGPTINGRNVSRKLRFLQPTNFDKDLNLISSNSTRVPARFKKSVLFATSTCVDDLVLHKPQNISCEFSTTLPEGAVQVCPIRKKSALKNIFSRSKTPEVVKIPEISPTVNSIGVFRNSSGNKEVQKGSPNEQLDPNAVHVIPTNISKKNDSADTNHSPVENIKPDFKRGLPAGSNTLPYRSNWNVDCKKL